MRPDAQSIETESIRPKLLGAIIATGSLAFIGILTETMMNVLFPELMSEYHVSTSTVQWITTVYLLSVAVTMPASSYLKRRFRLVTIFEVSCALAIAGSVLMLLGTNFAWIIIARIIQGIGSGIAMPLMLNIIIEQSPRSMIGRLMGFGALVTTVAPAIGPCVGGAVTQFTSWRMIFVVAIVLIMIALLVGRLCIEQRSKTQHVVLDCAQLAGITLSLSGAIIALNQGGTALVAVLTNEADWLSLALMLMGLVMLVLGMALFYYANRHSDHPLIRLTMLRSRSIRLLVASYTLQPAVSIGFGYVVTNIARIVLGVGTLEAGLLVLPGALAGALLAPVGGWLYDKYGAAKPIVIAYVLALIGPTLLCLYALRLNAFMLAGFYAMFAVCYAIGNQNVMTHAVERSDAHLKADANAVCVTGLQFGGALGTTLFSTLIGIAQATLVADNGLSYAQASAVGGLWCYIAMLVICAVVLCALGMVFILGEHRSTGSAQAVRQQ